VKDGAKTESRSTNTYITTPRGSELFLATQTVNQLHYWVRSTSAKSKGLDQTSV